MVNVAKKGKRRIVAICIVCAVACALLVAPTVANAFWYVHSDDNVENSTAKGAIEVLVTIDATAQGGGTYCEEAFVPSDGTVGDLLDEIIHSDENYEDVDALHDYEVISLGDYLADSEYTITVYNNGEDQEAGTHTTYDSEGTEADESTQLERFNTVVFTLK